MNLRRDGSIIVQIKEIEKTEIVVVMVTGVVDTGTTLVLDDHLSTLLREKRFKLIINLSGVTYVSSAGWGLFISLIQKTREHKGDIKLVGMNQDVINVFNMLAFSNLISAYPTEEEAILAFNRK
jgi:anti-sigma B factor antagonist